MKRLSLKKPSAISASKSENILVRLGAQTGMQTFHEADFARTST